jgi:hypothetical protein
LWGGRCSRTKHGLAAAPQLLLIEASTAEAHVIAASRGHGHTRGSFARTDARVVTIPRSQAQCARTALDARHESLHHEQPFLFGQPHAKRSCRSTHTRDARRAVRSDLQRAAHASRYNVACCRWPCVGSGEEAAACRRPAAIVGGGFFAASYWNVHSRSTR